MVINKKVKLVKTIFVEAHFVFWHVLAAASIVSSYVINELSIILPTYLPFSQLHVAGF